MKVKAFCLLLMGILFALPSQAQDDDHQQPERAKYTFGTEIGVTFGTPIGATQKGEWPSTFPAEDYNEKASGQPGLGLHGGIFARRLLNDVIGLQLGISYSRKKSKYQSPVYNQDYTYHQEIQLPDTIVVAVVDTYFNGEVRGEFNNQYVNVPLLVYYQANDRLQVHGGGYAAMLLKAGHEVWASGVVGDDFDTVDNRYQDESAFISDWDYGVNAGVNYRVFRQVECELRLSTGLRSIFTSDYVLGDAAVRNLYMEFKANYTFQF